MLSCEIATSPEGSHNNIGSVQACTLCILCCYITILFHALGPLESPRPLQSLLCIHNSIRHVYDEPFVCDMKEGVCDSDFVIFFPRCNNQQRRNCNNKCQASVTEYPSRINQTCSHCTSHQTRSAQKQG